MNDRASLTPDQSGRPRRRRPCRPSHGPPCRPFHHSRSPAGRRAQGNQQENQDALHPHVATSGSLPGLLQEQSGHHRRVYFHHREVEPTHDPPHLHPRSHLRVRYLTSYSAFNCEWHVFRRSLVNILTLAGPGVLWGAILIAVCFKLILAYPDDELSWYQALTLGCVLSATDPVAVVALLKELGASVRFNTLVEG